MFWVTLSNCVGLTFVGPRIVIYFYSKTNQMHVSNLFYFGKSLYIIRSLRLHAASGICRAGSVAAC